MSEDGVGTGDPMAAEFDVVPGWTVEAVRELGAEHALPAACRGSGGPGALRWLAEQLGLRAGTSLLDSGAGMGGPAELAAGDTGAHVVLAEPMTGACRAAVALFGRPTVVALGEALPFGADTFDVAWSLGVLCASDEQAGLVAELARVVRPGGAAGLLVYTRRVPHPDEQPEGNHFPTRDELDELLTAAGLQVRVQADLADLPAAGPLWTRRSDEIDALVERDHGDDPRWAAADAQHRVMARLIGSEQVGGTLLVADVPRAQVLPRCPGAPPPGRLPSRS